MGNWDGKPTSVLEARLCQLQGRTIEKGSSSNKMATTVSDGQSLRWRRWCDSISEVDNESRNLLLIDSAGSGEKGWQGQKQGKILSGKDLHQQAIGCFCGLDLCDDQMVKSTTCF